MRQEAMSSDEMLPLSRDELAESMDDATFAFRGYNVTNLGRTYELLQHPEYGGILRDWLHRGSCACSEVKRRPVDLVARVEEQRETSLSTYDEAIALVVSVEMAQIAMLEQVHDIALSRARFVFGFSLGEIATLVAGKVIELEVALRIPLMMSSDAAELAHDVTLGVLFSRRGQLSRTAVDRLCQEINLKGNGVIGVSAYLAPNSMLMIGQGDTLKRFKQQMKVLSAERLYLRLNEHRWPPLHTAIVWQRNITNRSQNLMHVMPGAFQPPNPPVFSLVTGSIGYDDSNTRRIIGEWVDRPQQLWEAVDYTLASGIETIVHVGPQPNIIPATFSRLATNVANQTKLSRGMRALSTIANRPWLKAMLPRRTSLLRAPQIRQFNLEDWLLDQLPATNKTRIVRSVQQ